MTNVDTSSTASLKKTEDVQAQSMTLEQLAREFGLSPRDARMMLRTAAKQTKLYPALGKDHVARQPWQWMPGSKALDEARTALSVVASL